MAFRFGLGPVFAYEWLMASRRWQMYALRSLFVVLLGAGLWFTWYMTSREQQATLRSSADAGVAFFYMLVGIQVTIFLLMAPAATAGAICLDKARGSLIHVLATDLSNSEIVLGKFAARLLPVLGLLLTALPVLSGALFLGGIAPDALLGAFMVELGVGVFGCALALTLSVWGKQTHEVLMTVYLLLAIALLAELLVAIPALFIGFTSPRWLEYLNPYLMAYLPYWRRGSYVLDQQFEFAVGCLVLSAVLLLASIWRVRAVTLAQLGQADRPPRASRFWRRRNGRNRWFGPGLDPNPVLWREWHRRRASFWMWMVWLTYGLLALGSSVAAITQTFAAHNPGGLRGRPDEIGGAVNGLQVLIGLLLLGLTAVTALGEERIRGSLDVLLSTPLPTWKIVWGKWLGSFRRVPLLAILPTAVAAGAALATHLYGPLTFGPPPSTSIPDGLSLSDLLGVLLIFGYVVAFGAAMTSLGLALATSVKQQGRALAGCVAIYVIFFFGLLFGAVALGPGPSDRNSQLLIMGNPLYGMLILTMGIGSRGLGPFHEVDQQLWTGSLWIALYSGVAASLYLLTLKTFDRHLGRITKRRSGAPPLFRDRQIAASAPPGDGVMPSPARVP